jgi:hydrogenase nickel incorporation protein HypB
VGRFHIHADGTGHVHGQNLDHDHEHDHDDDHAHDDHLGRAVDVGDHSGYAETGATRITILENLLSENDRVADDNCRKLAASGVSAVNLMSSPGAGKTTLLRKTLERLGDSVRIGVLEGDIATSLDADKLEGAGATAISVVNTSAGFGGECHLDAVMVQSGMSRLPLPDLDMLIIENVGNLVCPAEFRVGEKARAMVFAVTEGEEKPLKYPVMFRAADVVVVNKVDLLPHLDFDMQAFLGNLKAVNPSAAVIMASARTGEGVADWCGWLRAVSVLGDESAETLDRRHTDDRSIEY